jgi:hypothetical protein
VRDAGRRTPRGAIVPRAANGPKPDAAYLTPAEVEAALEQLLTAAVREHTDPRRKRADDHTFGEACDAWLAYVAHEQDRRPSTIGDYRNAVRRYLLPEFGADTLLHTIDTGRVDAYRERLLVEGGELSRRTIQKTLVLCTASSSAPSARAGSRPTRPPTPSASRFVAAGSATS